MSVVGIIAEYNPLHLGHAYHIQKAREITGAHACVCVLSSNFVQRGEPSLVSKWARTEMALKAGIDLVLELPSAFSCASAEYFASAAVKILDSLGFVDYLCFGSEEGALDALEATAQALAFESDAFKTHLKAFLDQGLSYAVSRQKALDLLQSKDPSEAPGQKHLDKPNNILGIEYMKALKRQASSIRPVTLKRMGEGYKSLEEASSFSSATAIRRYIETHQNVNPEDSFLQGNLPAYTLEILLKEIVSGRGPVFPEAYETILLHVLRNTPLTELARLPYMGEGLENRLKRAAMSSTTVGELVSATVTSRYPAARIKRILCALLMGMSGEFLEELKGNGYAQYLRVLGFNESGRHLLSKARKKAALPLLTKPAAFHKVLSGLSQKLFELEIRASDSYVLGFPQKAERKGSSEFLASPLYIRQEK